MQRGRVYSWSPDPASALGGSISVNIESLPRLDLEGEGKGRLWGRHVRVRNNGEVNEPDPVAGGIRVLPIGDAQANADGDFLFDPSGGGGRLDKVVLAAPEDRQRYIEASHFGEVNAYFHLDRVAAYVDVLLGQLGHSSLPRVTAIVNAHHAATERDGWRDGVFGTRSGRMIPMQGGHYRLPSWCYDPREFQPLSPTGEIHLGPGYQLHRDGAIARAMGGPYWGHAAHNGAILYHEYGHHLMRHTADVRANAFRPPDKQSNRKAAIDEGTCDYWAAVMLGTPHIWAWHRRHDEREIHPRSLASAKTMADYDSSPKADPHLNGTIWAAALWDLRTRLEATEPAGGRRTDLLVLKALLELGNITSPEGEAPTEYLPRVRASCQVGLVSLLRGDELLNGGRYREVMLACFSRRAIHPACAGSYGGDRLKVSA